MSLFAELKRRNVLRAGVLYIGAVWALAQGLAQLLPLFGDYEWIARWFVIAAIIGFPFWIAFAWFYELTPQGFMRESAVTVDAPQRYTNARKLDRAIIAVLAIAVVLLLTEVLVPRKAQVAEAVASAKSVAVLPFVNMSGDPQNEYFSDGITEEILDALAQLPNLKVAARTSAFAFKGKAEDLRKVGEVLDVATVLEGSVQKSGDEVRITAQLIDTRSGYHLWSEKYDRKLTSIFAVEDEISKAIADKLKVQLSGNDQTRVTAMAVDPRAHDFYLRGLTLLAAREVSEAAGAFQQAVAINPDYAQAWAMLAEAQALLPGYGPSAPQIAYGDSLESARRALALNPDSALAYVAQGMVYSNQMRWAEADRALRHALALAPGDAEALNQYAQFLHGVGQLAPALDVMDRALQRDPMSGISASIRVQLSLLLGRIDAAAAVAQIKAILAAHPESVFVHRAATNTYLGLHRYAEAEAQIRATAALTGGDPEAKALLIRGIADPAQRARAIQSLGSSGANADSCRDPLVCALFLIQLGQRDAALEKLGEIATDGNSTIPQMLWTSAFDPIRNDPRFQAVLKKIGLPYTPEKIETGVKS